MTKFLKEMAWLYAQHILQRQEHRRVSSRLKRHRTNIYAAAHCEWRLTSPMLQRRVFDRYDGGNSKKSEMQPTGKYASSCADPATCWL